MIINSLINQFSFKTVNCYINKACEAKWRNYNVVLMQLSHSTLQASIIYYFFFHLIAKNSIYYK